MDLETLLADLSSRFDADRRGELSDEAEDLAAAERVGITFDMRVHAAVGSVVSLWLRGGQRVVGRLVDSGRGWVLLDEGWREALVPCRALVAAQQLGGGGISPEGDLGVSIGHVLREISREGVNVVVEHEAGMCRGRICAVYRDHIDLEVDASGAGVDTRDRVVAGVLSIHLEGIKRLLLSRWG